MLAHKATREAHVAVEALAGEPAAFDNLAIPAVVFTDPEIAWCGLTETEAKNTNREVKVARFPWAASGRAQTLSRTEGLTKILFDPKTERVLGVGIVGAGSGRTHRRRRPGCRNGRRRPRRGRDDSRPSRRFPKR